MIAISIRDFDTGYPLSQLEKDTFIVSVAPNIENDLFVTPGTLGTPVHPHDTDFNNPDNVAERFCGLNEALISSTGAAVADDFNSFELGAFTITDGAVSQFTVAAKPGFTTPANRFDAGASEFRYSCVMLTARNSCEE